MLFALQQYMSSMLAVRILCVAWKIHVPGTGTAIISYSFYLAINYIYDTYIGHII